MSYPQTFHVERVSNLSCFKIMKQASFKKLVVETTLTNSGDQRHILLAQENQDNSWLQRERPHCALWGDRPAFQAIRHSHLGMLQTNPVELTWFVDTSADI